MSTRIFYAALVFVVAFCVGPSLLWAQEETAEVKPEEQTDIVVDKDPETKKNIHKICNCKYSADTPYTERRSRWGGYFGVQSGLFSPDNYIPDFRTNTTFADYYGPEKSPVMEAVMGLKLNFFLGSLSANISGGYFSAKNSHDNSALTLYPLTGGLLWALDNIFEEPYVVPYGLFGGYSMIYSEKVGGLSVSGNSPIGMFYAAGLMFQLNWLDKDSAYQGYDEYGLENTFLYLEARSFLTPPSNRAPDLSTPIQFGAGLKVEF